LAAAVVVAAIAGVSLLATGGRSTEAQAHPPPPGPTLVMECWRITEGNNPNALVRLITDNFARDDAYVREASRYCELGHKYYQPTATTQLKPPDTQVAWQCFNLAKGDDPDDEVILTTQNFGTHRAVVRRAVLMCENALKIRATAGQVTTYGNPALNRVYVCYQLEAANLPPTRFSIVTDNFGVDPVLARRPELLCEEAVKLRKGWEPFGVAQQGVFECFKVNGNTRNDSFLLRTRNFADDQVRLRTPEVFCELAQKRLLYDHDPAAP
jgi:hypothetical protein